MTNPLASQQPAPIPEKKMCKFCDRVIVFYSPVRDKGYGLWVHKSTMDETCHPVATLLGTPGKGEK